MLFVKIEGHETAELLSNQLNFQLHYIKLAFQSVIKTYHKP